MAQGGRPAAAELPKLAGLLDDAETDVLAYMTFPAPHRATPPAEAALLTDVR